MKFKFNITGLDCPVCASKLATLLAEGEGIDYAKINFLTEKLTVDSKLSEDSVLKLSQEAATRFSPEVKIEK